MNEKMIRITLRHSGIGRPPKHRRTLASMGLRRINQTVIRQDTPAMRGMIRQVSHLLEVQE